MQVGIFAKTFAGKDPLTVLRAAKSAGYSCVQYNMACSGLTSLPDEVSDKTIAAIRDAVSQTGISIVALSATYNMIHNDAAVRSNGLRSLGELARVAKALDIPLLTLCTGTRDPQDQWRYHPDNSSPEAWRDLLVEVEKALRIADGVTLGIEPEHANVVGNAAKAEELLKAFYGAPLKIVFDPANLFETEPVDQQRALISDALHKLAPHIAIAHAKDRSSTGGFVAAGTGVLDYSHFIGALEASGFSGPMITHGLEAHEAANVAQFLKGYLK
jgi:sugar phosphate isomerase/epimerase